MSIFKLGFGYVFRDSILAIAYLLLPYKASAGSHISQFLGDVSSILYNHLLYNHRYNAFRCSHEILYLSSNDKSIQICQNQEEPTWFHEILNKFQQGSQLKISILALNLTLILITCKFAFLWAHPILVAAPSGKSTIFASKYHVPLFT